MEVKISPLVKNHSDTETQLLKLSALVQTTGFILEGVDVEGTKARKSEGHAVAFANRFTAYSEMLFLVLSRLQDCKDALEKLCEKEWELIRAIE